MLFPQCPWLYLYIPDIAALHNYSELLMYPSATETSTVVGLGNWDSLYLYELCLVLGMGTWDLEEKGAKIVTNINRNHSKSNSSPLTLSYLPFPWYVAVFVTNFLQFSHQIHSIDISNATLTFASNVIANNIWTVVYRCSQNVPALCPGGYMLDTLLIWGTS